jgi:ABC-2 type transport system ATP-binding protein
MSSRWAVEVSGLVMEYSRDRRALDGVDLRIAPGTVLGLLGPNGAGKTTTVRILTTLLRPTAGRVRVAGIDVVAEPMRVRRRIGLSGQYAAVDENLTGFENLRMVGRLYGMSRQAASLRADELLATFGLTDARNLRSGAYSGGMRRRLDLAGALVARPRVVVLDEPTTGLDPRARQDMWRVIGELAADGATVLLTTQYLEEADRLSDRITVIDHGRVIANGSPEELKATIGGEQLTVTLADISDVPAAMTLLGQLGIGRPNWLEADSHDITVPVAEGSKTMVEALRGLDRADIGVNDARVSRPSLDDVFFMLTGKADDKSDAERSDADKSDSDKSDSDKSDTDDAEPQAAGGDEPQATDTRGPKTASTKEALMS